MLSQEKIQIEYDDKAIELVSSNGEIFAVVNKERKLDIMQSFVEIWNLKTGQLIQKVTKNQYLIQQMALSPEVISSEWQRPWQRG